MSVAGFDVGSDTAVVGLARRKGIDVVLNAESGRMTPSMVAFSPKQRFLGCIAGHNIATNPTNTVNKIKRILGKKFNDPELQEEIKDALYDVTEGADGYPLITVQYLGEERKFTTEQVMAMLLGELKTIAEKDQGTKIADCVISCPVYSTDAQRRALLDAAQITGLNCLRLMPETTATALSYGIYKTDLPEKEAINVAFVDIGEASLQCCIVAFKKGQLKVLAHGYDRNFGGRSLDNILIDHFAAEFKAKTKIDVFAKPRSLLRMRVAVEKMKKVLSANYEATISVECLADDLDFQSKLTRDQMEEMATECLSRVKIPLELCLKESGIAQADLHSAEVVGNASRIPSVIKTIESVFGQEIRRTLNASESVARGCALQGAMLSPAFKVRDFEVQDAYPFPLAFTWKKADDAGKPTDEDVTEVIFPKNGTSVPSTKVLTLMRSESFSMKCSCAEPDLLPPGTNPHISEFQIGPIPKTKDGSVPKLKVTLKLNLHGIACVDSVQSIEEQIVEKPVVEEKKEEEAAADAAMETEKKEEKKEEPKVEKKKIRTDVPVKAVVSGLSTTVLQQYVEKEFDMAMADRVMEETKERKNAVEEYVYNMRQQLCDKLSEYASEDLKTSFTRTLEDTENWLYEDGEDETKGVYVAKLEELGKLGNPIMERHAENETRAGAAQLLDTVAGVFIAQCGDEKYAHIAEEERAKVLKECSEAKAWLADKMAQQAALPKDAPLVVLSREIEAKKEMIERVCKPIVSKPKPKPAVVTPEDIKAEDPTPMEEGGDKPAEGDQNMGPDGADEPAPMQADLD